MNPRPKVTIVSPTASPEEAAVVVAALECFIAETVRPPAQPAQNQTAWQRAALHEGVARKPGDPLPGARAR